MSDLPHTLLPPRDAKGEQKGKVTQEDIDEATRLTLEAAERKRKRLEREKAEYTVEEVFAGEADQ